MAGRVREVVGIVATAAGALLAMFACFTTLREAERTMCFDYYQAWVAATAANEGDVFDETDIYTVAGRQRLDRTFDQRASAYVGSDPAVIVKSRRAHAAHETREIRSSGTPWHYTVLGWISGEDYDRDQLVWQVLSLAALLVAVGVFGRAAGQPLPVLFFAAAFFAAAFLPARSDLWVGNLARVQVGAVALVAAVAWSQRGGRHVAAGVAGALLGTLVVFKPNLAPLCVVLCAGWLASGQGARLRSTIAGLAVGALGSLVAASLHFGTWRAWTAWFRQLRDVGGSSSVEAGNLAALSPFQRMAPGLVGMLLEACFWALLAAGAIRLLRRRGVTVEHRREDLLLIGVGCAVSALASPVSWDHYYVLLVPLIAFVFRPPERSRARPSAWGAWGLWVLALVAIVAVAQPERLFLGMEKAVAAPTLAAYALIVLALVRWSVQARDEVPECADSIAASAQTAQDVSRFG